MKKVHSEIIYTTDTHPDMKGKDITIHSDTCPIKCNFENITDDYKKYAHALLDEWLEKSNGTGIFYIKEDGFTDYGNED